VAGTDLKRIGPRQWVEARIRRPAYGGSKTNEELRQSEKKRVLEKEPGFSI